VAKKINEDKVDLYKAKMLLQLEHFSGNITRAADSVGLYKDLHYYWCNPKNTDRSYLKKYDPEYSKKASKILKKYKKERSYFFKLGDVLSKKLEKLGGIPWIINTIKNS